MPWLHRGVGYNARESSHILSHEGKVSKRDRANASNLVQKKRVNEYILVVQGLLVNTTADDTVCRTSMQAY